MSPTVHVLYHGFVLCGSIHGIPSGWGPDHRWVSAFDGSWPEHATCSGCRESAWKLAIWGDIPRHDTMLPPAGACRGGDGVSEWSKETEKLGERYRILYGFTQGAWAATTLAALMSWGRPIWQTLVMYAFGAVTSALWRWSWLKYRAAFIADTQKVFADAFAERALREARRAADDLNTWN